MELSTPVWKSVVACAHAEDDMKQTKKNYDCTKNYLLCQTLLEWVGHNDLGLTLHGPVEFCRVELRHASCFI